jgi:predicted phosphodiesterase
MKIVALGDTHGRVIWKEIVEKEKDADMIVFIGDYFDTHHSGVSGNKQLVNFKEILEFKRANPNKVIMLTGNHDFHYMRGIGENYSGYQAGYAIDFGEAIHDALSDDSLQMCWVHDKYVFTHAGVTKTWAWANEIDVNNLAQSINDLFKFKPNKFKFTVGPRWDNYGDDITQTPIWVRPESLHNDILSDITCVVGHTTQESIKINNDIILIDTLGTSQEYLVIENNIAKIVK